MLESLIASLEGAPTFRIAVVAAIIAGLATCLGAVPVFFVRRISRRWQVALLSFGAGVMLAAAFFSLLAPGLEIAGELTESRIVPPLWLAAALMLGAGLFFLADHCLSYENFISGPAGVSRKALRRVWLFVIAIAIHNLPEGLSVGIGFAGDSLGNGLAITAGISAQNIPEGLIVAVVLVSVNYTRLQAFGVVAVTGLVMSVGGILGAAFITLTDSPLMPWALGFAAGAMIYVIIDEIIPQTHRNGYRTPANLGFIIGFILMMFLDLALDLD